MKKNRIASLLSLFAMVGAGIVLVACPGGVLATAVRVCGAVLLGTGLIGTAGQLLKKDKSTRSLPGLILSIAETISGIIVTASPAFIISLFPIITGVMIGLTGIANLFMALDMQRFRVRGWKPAAILSAASIALGVLVFANPFSTMAVIARIAGIILLYNGISGTAIYLADARNKETPIIAEAI